MILKLKGLCTQDEIPYNIIPTNFFRKAIQILKINTHKFESYLYIKTVSGGGKFSKLHNSNLTCNKPLISTDSHSMAASFSFIAL